MEKELIEFIKARYIRKYDLKNFKKDFEIYKDLKAFKPNESLEDSNQRLTESQHFILRLATQFYLTKAFEAMRIDLTDPNVAEDLDSGNIGTPGRIAKVWVGGHLNDDTELGSGRFSERPRIASFPNTSKERFPITKEVDLVSNCSHHNIIFSSLMSKDAYCLVSYIPNERVLGISKLQRLVNYVSKRFWLQEDLTKAIYDEVSKAAGTESVFVVLKGIQHGCERFRGSKSSDGSFDSEYYGGDFKDAELRKSVLRNRK